MQILLVDILMIFLLNLREISQKEQDLREISQKPKTKLKERQTFATDLYIYVYCIIAFVENRTKILYMGPS